MIPNVQPWLEIKPRYDFADEFAALSGRVKGAGSRERFDYWNHYFAYMKSVAELGCAWGEYTNILSTVATAGNRAEQKKIAHDLVLPAREKIAGLMKTVYGHLLSVVSTTGELGTVANWEEHILPHLIDRPGAKLAEMMGEALPREALLPETYEGPPRIIVPALRGCLMENETSRLRVLILSREPARQAALHWPKTGSRSLPRNSAYPSGPGGLFRAVSARRRRHGILHHRRTARGSRVYYPATAPAINQTIVTLPAGADK